MAMETESAAAAPRLVALPSRGIRPMLLATGLLMLPSTRRPPHVSTHATRSKLPLRISPLPAPDGNAGGQPCPKPLPRLDQATSCQFLRVTAATKPAPAEEILHSDRGDRPPTQACRLVPEAQLGPRPGASPLPAPPVARPSAAQGDALFPLLFPLSPPLLVAFGPPDLTTASSPHLHRDADERGGEMSSGSTCYKLCRSFRWTWPAPVRGAQLDQQQEICLLCRERGHSLKNCPDKSDGNLKKFCYNCGGSGRSFPSAPSLLKMVVQLCELLGLQTAGTFEQGLS